MISGLYYKLHRFFSRSQERGEYSAGLWPHMLRVEALKFIHTSGGKLLEVGCGEGLFLTQLSEAHPGMELWGVDNSGERVQQAQQRLAGKNCHVSVENATQLSFEDGSFDVVVCVNVFFNMPSIEVVRKTLSEMKRVVRNDGRLIFDFRNSKDPFLVLKYKLAPFYDWTVRDVPLKTYSLEQVSDVLKELGLAISGQKVVGAMALFSAPIILIEARKI